MIKVIQLNENQSTLSQENLAQFRQLFRGPILLPDNESYDDVRALWNGMHDRKPALIARCTGTADVVDAVNFAREHNLLTTVRGGGHHVAGLAAADDALMIDLSLMRGIQVDPQKRIARAQAGATWGDLDRETQLFGLATPGGVVSTTGIAGLTLGGGIGLLRRKYGLACDNLIATDLVTADGQVRRVNAEEHSDLFWAIRGGGGNFGIVTNFEYQLHPLDPMIMNVATLYPQEEARTILRKWRDFMATSPDEITSQAVFWAVPRIDPIPQELWGKPVVVVAALYAGTAEMGERMLQPLRELATPVVDLSHQMPYCAAQQAFDPFFPKGGHLYYNKSTDLTSLDDEVLDAIISRAGESPTPETVLVLWLYGGAMSRVGVEETAFSGRNVPALYSVDATWDEPADSERIIGWARDYIKSLAPYSAGGLYSNFAGDLEAPQAVYGRNHDRLVEIKTKYDPTNFFRMNQNIKPQGAS